MSDPIVSTFEITGVDELKTREFQTKHGSLMSYSVSCRSDQGEAEVAELVKKPESQPPRVGESFVAELIPKAGYPPRLKRLSEPPAKASAPFEGPSAGGAVGPFPDRRGTEIVRQHSQEMAIRWIHLLELRGKVPADANLDWVRSQIDWFEEDAKAAGARA